MAFSVVFQDQLFCTVFQEFLDKLVDLLLLLQTKTPYGQTINQKRLQNLKKVAHMRQYCIMTMHFVTLQS